MSGILLSRFVVPSASLLTGSESDGTQRLGVWGNANFNAGFFGAQQATFTGSQTDASGGSAGTILTEAATTNIHRCYINPTFSATYTASTNADFSVYAKYNGRRYLVLSIRNSAETAGFTCCFDVQNGLTTATNSNIGVGSFTTSTIQQGANGYWKCTMSGIISTSNVTSGWCYVAMNSGLSSNVGDNYAGDGSSGMILWRPKVAF